MDSTKVAQIARKHRELVTSLGPGAPLEAEAARHEEAEALNGLFSEIETECDAYCRSYNDAFGEARLRMEPHGDTIVIRSQLDQEDTLVFRRVAPSHTQGGRIEAHRYHYREQPVHLPVDVRRTEQRRLMLTLRGRDVAAAELVLDLLTTFSEHIARTEAAAGGEDVSS
jgi:hypothetical protein